jgi:hypothetical protein
MPPSKVTLFVTKKAQSTFGCYSRDLHTFQPLFKTNFRPFEHSLALFEPPHSTVFPDFILKYIVKSWTYRSPPSNQWENKVA